MLLRRHKEKENKEIKEENKKSAKKKVGDK